MRYLAAKKVKNLTNWKISKNTYWVIGTQGVGAFMSLVFGKILALYINPSVFGLYSLQYAIYTLTLSLLIAPTIQYFKANAKKIIPKIGYFYLLPVLGLEVVLCSFLVYLLSLYNNLEITNPVLIVIGFFFIFNTIFNLLTDSLNIHGKIRTYSKVLAIKSILSTVFLFVLFEAGFVTEPGSGMIWLAQLLGIVISALLITRSFVFPLKGTYNVSFYKWFKSYAKFAWPLIFMAFFAWINNFFDRFVIEEILELREVGLYNASYSVGSKFFLIYVPLFLTILTPLVYENIKLEEKKNKAKKYISFYLLSGIVFLVLIFLNYKLIGELLLSHSYSDGFLIIPWVAFAFYILTLSHLYELVFYSEGKTNFILYTNVAAAIMNVVLNIYLVQSFSIIGAAFASLISYSFKLFLTIILYSRL